MDNSPQFISQEFEVFLKANGIQYYRSAFYHLATNGEAERYVQTFKQAMRAAKNDPGTLPTKLMRFLLSYRTTLNVTTGVFPAELLFGKTLRTRLNLLRPDVSTKVQDAQASQKEHHNKRSKERYFQVGQSVLVENNRPEPKWVVGTILERYFISSSDWNTSLEKTCRSNVTNYHYSSQC